MVSVKAEQLQVQEAFLREVQIRRYYRELRELAEETAEFHEKIPDYIVLRWANKEIDAALEAKAAEIVVYKFLEGLRQTGVQIDFQKLKFLGIENSGVSFAKAVMKALQEAVKIEIPQDNFLTVHKLKPGEEIPPQSKEKGLIITAPSPTAGGEKRTYEVPSDLIPQDCPVFVLDDVIAKGNIGKGVIDNLQEHNIQVVGMGAYFTKLFMHGKNRIQRIKEGKIEGVPVFSALEINEITTDEKGKRGLDIAPFNALLSADQNLMFSQRYNTEIYSPGRWHPSSIIK